MIGLQPSTPCRLGPLLAAAQAAWIMAILLCGAGCDRRITSTYGAVRGDSINGLAAFVQLLRDGGHATTALQRLPARIDDDVRTVIVVDDSFTGLRPEARDVLEAWRKTDGRHTLVLVLRDSDALIEYLREILTGELPADRREVARQRLDDAEQTLATATAGPRVETPSLFDALAVAERPATSESTEVTVRPRGADGDTITARWSLRRRLRSRAPGQVLWESGEDRLLVRHRAVGLEVLVMASAAPLLNGGLVDPGNRELTAGLAALLPTNGRILLAGSSQVAEAGGQGGADGGGGDEAEEPSPWRLLAVQPLPWLAAQAIVALGLFCWCTAPIFGRPREVSPTHAQDFGHHVDALANLVSKSTAAGPAFARRRLDEWRAAAPSQPGGRPRRGSRPTSPSDDPEKGCLP